MPLANAQGKKLSVSAKEPSPTLCWRTTLACSFQVFSKQWKCRAPYCHRQIAKIHRHVLPCLRKKLETVLTRQHACPRRFWFFDVENHPKKRIESNQIIAKYNDLRADRYVDIARPFSQPVSFLFERITRQHFTRQISA